MGEIIRYKLMWVVWTVDSWWRSRKIREYTGPNPRLNDQAASDLDERTP